MLQGEEIAVNSHNYGHSVIWELAPLKGRTTNAAGLVPVLFVFSLDKFGLGDKFSVQRMKIEGQFSSLAGMDLGEFQTTIRHLASQQPSSDSETDEEPYMQAESYHVHCRLCSNYLCELSDIRRYMKSYHLVLNPSIHEKVDLKSPATSFLKFFDCKYSKFYPLI